jgi:NAD(P)H dehydrogenase (quinone)
MTKPLILVAFYSAHGTNRRVAEIVARTLAEVGAEPRLRRFAETAAEEVVEADEEWAATLESMRAIPEISKDDVEEAEGYFFVAPTHYGAPPGAMVVFTDTLGPLWKQQSMADKPFTAATAAQFANGGQEGTIGTMMTMAMHWGCVLVPPGYADPVKFEDGGNPYGYSQKAGADPEEASIAFQARRLAWAAERLRGGRD